MEYEQFVKLVHRKGVVTTATTRILYAIIPNPPHRQLLVRWGKDELLAYIDIRVINGKLEDIYCKPLKDVMEPDIDKFVELFNNLYWKKGN